MQQQELNISPYYLRKLASLLEEMEKETGEMFQLTIRQFDHQGETKIGDFEKCPLKIHVYNMISPYEKFNGVYDNRDDALRAAKSLEFNDLKVATHSSDIFTDGGRIGRGMTIMNMIGNYRYLTNKELRRPSVKVTVSDHAYSGLQGIYPSIKAISQKIKLLRQKEYQDVEQSLKSLNTNSKKSTDRTVLLKELTQLNSQHNNKWNLTIDESNNSILNSENDVIATFI